MALNYRSRRTCLLGAGVAGFCCSRKTLKPTDCEKKLNEALSKKNWGASGTLMGEIAQLTFDYQQYSIVMKAVWESLNNSGKNWRVVFKGLSLLEHLIKHGTERVIDDSRDHIHQIRTLNDFSHFVDGVDKGSGVREKSKQLVELLNDNTLIREERQKARQLREKFTGIGSRGSMGGGGGGSSYRVDGGVLASHRLRFRGVDA